MGKTDAMQRMIEAMGGFSRAIRGTTIRLIAFDEFQQDFPRYLPDRPDRSHYERGGRYRKPPVTKREKPPEPGMVQVRDRAGDLVWKKIGKGFDAGRRATAMKSNPAWGMFS